MNGNRSIVYREFVGVIPVAKTLRNELRPVGHTQEHIIQNGLIQEDELRQEKSTESKNIMDDYYKESVNEKTVYQVFNVLFVLCIGAYLIWFGNPEFNNSSGLLAFYSNFGFFGIPLQVIFGYLIGRSYRMFKRGNILGIVIYSYVVYLLLELPRFFSFGTLQFFLFYGCSFNILDYG